MSQNNSRKKQLLSPTTNTMLPLLGYKQIISLVILLLVTSPSLTQSPYVCPTDCECNVKDFSARCENLESLISSYSRKYASRKLMPIKSLDLSNNELTKISNQLEVLVNLTELNLSHNKLTQVHKLNFQHLEKLDLSHNHITSGKLSKLPKNIVELNISYNDITYLPVDFMKLKKLRTLDLHENPLNCTCETLHVRNWMSYQNVWSSKVIKCTSPQIVKGQPWLQARQSEICFEATSTQRSNIHDKWDDYDGNDIMMGDQPQDENVDVEYDDGNDDDKKDEIISENEDDNGRDIFDEEKDIQKDEPTGDDVNDYDELDKEFIKLDHHHHDSTTAKPEESVDQYPEAQAVKEEEQNEEGSGEPAPIIQVTNQEEEDDDGSGSGGGILIVLPDSQSSSSESKSSESTTKEPEAETDYDDPAPATEKPEEKEEDADEATIVPVLSPGRNPNLSLGIFEDFTDPPTVIIGKQKDKLREPETETVKTDTEQGGLSENIKTATAEDNTGTYVLLAIIGILLVSLIIFVAMKNRKEKREACRNYDVEKNGATELQDMDKRLLGKPLEKNGNGKHTENSPLINDHHDGKDDHPHDLTSFKAPEITVDEPVQELPHKEKDKSQQSLYDMPNGNGAIHEPIEPVHSSPNNGALPKSPDSDDEVFHPASDAPIDPQSLSVSPEPPKRYSPVYTPVSPRSERYSPVYSPETGRVKIKLTETPKPKTPVVVTRSRSRAGDYINTPSN